jgi:SAM-dependent methyltransferase
MDNYDVVSCDECGFVYANNIPKQDMFDQYYAKMSKYEFEYKEGVVAGEYFAFFNRVVEFLVDNLDNKKLRILEIGCSTGALLSILQSKGYTNIVGMDPSQACVDTVKNLYEIEAFVGTISTLAKNEKFDVIIMTAVLEHIVDIDAAMKILRSNLKNDGLLLLEVPDAERFDEYIFTPFQQFSIEHIDYFSESSLKNLLGKHSFEFIDSKKSVNDINQTIDPDIFIIARKVKKIDYEFVNDRSCEFRLMKYINKCSILLKEVDERLKVLLSEVDKVIVWGVGTHTQSLLDDILDPSKIAYFVDSNTNYEGKKLLGIEIKAPDKIDDNDIPILLSTFSYQDEVKDQIRNKLNLKNEIMQIYES